MPPIRNTITFKHSFWLYVVGIAAAIALVLVAARVAGAAETEEPSFWMKKKMEYSEKILAGLAKADFAEIEKNATSMNGLSQIEKWVRAGSPAYKHQLAAFRSANKSLIRTAQEEDIDGATLAFMQLTQSCVQCHKLIRDTAK
jgi:cytochrome c556